MKKTNEFLFDGIFWSIIEKYNQSPKEEKIKFIFWCILAPIFILLLNMKGLFFYIEIMGIIHFFKLKRGYNQLHSWILFSLFILINGMIILGLIIVIFGILISPFA